MKKASFIAILGALVFLGSCKDIIEKDISGDTPVVILPQVNDTVDVNPVHFKWEEMSGATKYHLEIVSPSFADLEVYALDSIVTGTNFFFGLDSAEYQFRITALNAGYESKTSVPYTFWVGTSAGGSNNGGVVLDVPSQNAYLNETFDGQFKWINLPGTNTYTFELHKTNAFSGQLLDIADQLGSVSIFSLSGAQLDEGEYCWGVKSFLSNGNETAYTKRVFYVDTTDPGVATLVAPVSNTTASLSLNPDVTFSWTFPTNSGIIQSPLIARLQFSTTTNFSAIVATRNYNSAQTSAAEDLNNLSLPAGMYYWRIIVLDEAGNIGDTPTTFNSLLVTN
ncbi:MAG: hypothetical protein QE487_00710 [Fluviicola sp.]|nr:hypothetical protein [Fluviicola sp.]